MSIRNFSYPSPHLLASQAVHLNHILKDEVEKNYKTVKNKELFKSPIFLIALIIGVLGLINFLFFPATIWSIIIGFPLIIVAVFLLIVSYGIVNTETREKIEAGVEPARNFSVKKWILERYGKDVDTATVATLIHEFYAGRDTLVRLDDTLVRFQEVNGEGQFLFNSAGLELYTPIVAAEEIIISDYEQKETPS